MDTFTQIALGAAIGQAVGYRRLGRAALALGAVGGTIPDLDVVTGSLGALAEWQYHRGVTHSLFFGPVVGPILGYGFWHALRRLRPQSPSARPEALGAIVAVLVLSILTHPLLDLCTVYGTQLLAPFSDARFVIPAVPIIDPIYTVILLVAVAFGLARHRVAIAAAAAGLTLSSAFLLYAWDQNQRAEAEARHQLRAAGTAGEVRAYTTIFQPWLRRIVVQEGGQVRIGFLSTWRPAEIPWLCVSRADDPLIDQAFRTPEVQILTRFAQGQIWPSLYRDEQERAVVRFTDLRYGVPGATATGWWGVDVTFDLDGRVASAARIAVPRPPVSWDTIAAIYRAGLGDMAGFYAASGAPLEQADTGSC